MTTDHAVRLLRERLPHRFEGMYLHGSLGWGEFFPGSDIDYVVTLREGPTDDDIVVLREIQADIAAAGGPPFDGFYLAGEDLSRSPGELNSFVGFLENEFHSDVTDQNPVTWHELASHGITVAGPDLSEKAIHTDLPALQAFSRANLGSYWLSNANGLERAVGLDNPEFVTWCALGITRLHHVLVENSITSKSGAGRWAIETLDHRHTRVLRDALVHRETGSPNALDGEVRRLACVDLMRDVLAQHGC